MTQPVTDPAKDAVTQAVTGRRSIRRFLPDPIPRETLEAILEGAARAPSGTNTQPWGVTVVTGAARDRVSEAVLKAAGEGRRRTEYDYMPDPLPEPYITRKRTVGYALYALRGIARDDYPARLAAMLDNFRFFGAPVGMFFHIDRRLLIGSWLDMGMFLQNVMILARAHGLETCPQQAWCEFGPTVHAAIGLGEDRVLVTGMAMGVIDPDAPENALVTERAALEDWARFL